MGGVHSATFSRIMDHERSSCLSPGYERITLRTRFRVGLKVRMIHHHSRPYAIDVSAMDEGPTVTRVDPGNVVELEYNIFTTCSPDNPQHLPIQKNLPSSTNSHRLVPR